MSKNLFIIVYELSCSFIYHVYETTKGKSYIHELPT